MSRKIRGKNQVLFLIEALDEENKYERKYNVMGSTGNVYNICIKNKPSCTCPDHLTRRVRCKHIYFVLLRIMKVKRHEEDVSNYENSELLTMFKRIPKITNNLKVNKQTYDKYNILKNGDDKKDVSIKQKSLDDLCPICLDDLDNGKPIEFCKYSCGKNIHKKCFSMWNKTRSKKECVFCRKPWNVTVSGEYINLS